jgi:branched-subunit amino acid transport protein
VAKVSDQAIWLTISISVIVMLAMRIIGYLLPPQWVSKERVLRITALIPIVLLAALIAVQTMTSDSELVIDHRFVGLLAGAIALYFKRSFLTVMVIAGATGSLFYNLI